MELEQFLKTHGWVLECESPLEIRSEDGESFANGTAAEIVIVYLETIDE